MIIRVVYSLFSINSTQLRSDQLSSPNESIFDAAATDDDDEDGSKDDDDD